MGQVFSGGGSRPVTAEELQSVLTMRQELARLPVPTLQHRDDPHEYLYFAFFDGTGQDVNNPKLGPPTNVGLLSRQVEKLERDPSNRIARHYSRGIGTQPNAMSRVVDGALALTWDDGIKEAYTDLVNQVDEWKRADPQAQIRIAGMGYSRGAVQEPGFHRLVDQYGILPREELTFGRDRHGNLTVESPHPPLVPPGQVAQVALLLDPVATQMPGNYDARLPGSAISAVSFLAGNEGRPAFPHQSINDPGMTPDGRAINVKAPGGHSNVGGGNAESGLETLVGNTATDYLNLLRDEPLFAKRPVPADLSTMTVHQVRNVTAGFGLVLDHDGQRNLREELANCRIVDPCRDSEPMDRALAAQFEYRRIQWDPREQEQIQRLIQQASARQQDETHIGEHRRVAQIEMPAAAPSRQEFHFHARTAEDAYVEAFLNAAERGDGASRQALTQQYEQWPHVQARDQAARELLKAERQRALEEQLRQQELERQRQAQQEQQRSHGRAFSR